MAIKRWYSCNFCGVDYTNNRSDLMGIHFTGSYASSAFEYKNAEACENHLCKKCIEAIKGKPVPEYNNPNLIQ